MSIPTDPEKQENTYVIDAESGVEMARLMDLDHMFTEGMGGLFSERSDLHGISRVLDIGCGPGGWALEVGFTYPKIEVVGVDISQAMVDYARSQAAVQHLRNVRFHVMDATRNLAFADRTFDLVNARAFSGFLGPAVWSRMIQECRRVLRSGGVLRLTDGEWGFVTSPALEQLIGLYNQALAQAGQSFSPNGLTNGITPMLSHFLQMAGCQRIHHKAHALDFSSGTKAHPSYYHNMRVAFILLQPFLLKWKVTTQEEVSHLYERALAEMRSPDFRALVFMLTVWGDVL